MEHRLEELIQARPGEFEFLVRQIIHDNPKRTPKQRTTHVTLWCEICDRQLTTHIGGAEGVAKRFDKHDGCKPESEWPKRADPLPRMNPTERAAERERIRRELEGEE